MPPLNIVLPLAQAVAAHQAGRLDEAERICRQIVTAQPENAEAWHELGRLEFSRGRFAAALEMLERAVALRPQEPLYHNNHAMALLMAKRFEAAQSVCERVLKTWPGDLRAMVCLAKAIYLQGRVDEAIEAYHRALAIEPRHVEALADLGKAYRGQLKWELAREYLERALAADPNHVDSHLTHAYLVLSGGDLLNGLEEYEWRWRSGEAKKKRHPQHPEWKGEDLRGKTILVWAEQGYGDTIQFFRYVDVLAGMGAKVVVECQNALKSLLVRSPVVAAVRASGEPLLAFDYQIALASVPRVLKATLETIPSRMPYLVVDEKKVKSWAERMAAERRNEDPGNEASGDRGNGRGRLPRVGLCWAGNAAHSQDKLRSIPVGELGPLGAVEGAEFYSLQKAEKAAGAAVTWPAGLRVIDKTGSLTSFEETAALMMNLDLVITVDTAVAHLAGALNVPVWVLVHYPADWRWMFEREDSPWYPSMRLFRQTEEMSGRWGEVVGRVAGELRERAREN